MLIPNPPQLIRACRRPKELTIIAEPNVRIRHWIENEESGKSHPELCQGDSCLLCKLGHENSLSLQIPVRWDEKDREGFIFLYERQLETLVKVRDVVGVKIRFWRDGKYSNSPIEIEVLSA